MACNTFEKYMSGKTKFYENDKFDIFELVCLTKQKMKYCFFLCSICYVVKLGKMNCLIMVIYRVSCKTKLHKSKVRYSAICKIKFFFLEGGGNIFTVCLRCSEIFKCGW